ASSPDRRGLSAPNIHKRPFNPQTLPAPNSGSKPEPRRRVHAQGKSKEIAQNTTPATAKSSKRCIKRAKRAHAKGREAFLTLTGVRLETAHCFRQSQTRSLAQLWLRASSTAERMNAVDCMESGASSTRWLHDLHDLSLSSPWITCEPRQRIRYTKLPP